MPATPGVTFSFGENWKKFVRDVSEASIAAAVRDLEEWFGEERIVDRTVIDIGSGSGLHSLAFLRLGAASVTSFDYDPRSVEATRELWEREGRPSNWSVASGSVLDRPFLNAMGKFDVVYSWGVLHHTGDMWQAIENATTLVRPGGAFWIAIYVAGPNYERHLASKRKYNAAPPIGKRLMEAKLVGRHALGQLVRGRSPLGILEGKDRGMQYYRDVVDWLGGLPYEVATPDEIVRFARQRGLVLDRIGTAPEGSCATYVFTRPAD